MSSTKYTKSKEKDETPKKLNVGIAVGLLLGIENLTNYDRRSQVGHSKRITLCEVDERWRNGCSVTDCVEICGGQVLPLPPDSVKICVVKVEDGIWTTEIFCQLCGPVREEASCLPPGLEKKLLISPPTATWPPSCARCWGAKSGEPSSCTLNCSNVGRLIVRAMAEELRYRLAVLLRPRARQWFVIKRPGPIFKV